METPGVSGMWRYASHPGMKGDNANWREGTPFGSLPYIVFHYNRLSAGFQCSLDIAGETWDTFHKIDEQIG